MPKIQTALQETKRATSATKQDTLHLSGKQIVVVIRGKVNLNESNKSDDEYASSVGSRENMERVDMTVGGQVNLSGDCRFWCKCQCHIDRNGG